MMNIIIGVLLQCTWGIVQTLVGLGYFLLHLHNPHTFYHGAIVTESPYAGNVSLGLFLFVEETDARMKAALYVHEYGHFLQSMILGPLYLPLVGLPSLLWCHLPCFEKQRAEGRSYYSFFIEKHANMLGEKITHQEAPK